MRYYIATSFFSNDRHNYLRDRLKEELDADITYDWTTHVETEASANRELCAINDVQGVKDCDLLIVLLPGGLGTHAELGMALALEKKVIIVSEDSEIFKPLEVNPVFYFHPNVTRYVGCESELELIDEIDDIFDEIKQEKYDKIRENMPTPIIDQRGMSSAQREILADKLKKPFTTEDAERVMARRSHLKSTGKLL